MWMHPFYQGVNSIVITLLCGVATIVPKCSIMSLNYANLITVKFMVRLLRDISQSPAVHQCLLAESDQLPSLQEQGAL